MSMVSFLKQRLWNGCIFQVHIPPPGIYEVEHSLLRQPFQWNPRFSDLESSNYTYCRNSVQGKELIVDERGMSKHAFLLFSFVYECGISFLLSDTYLANYKRLSTWNLKGWMWGSVQNHWVQSKRHRLWFSTKTCCCYSTKTHINSAILILKLFLTSLRNIYTNMCVVLNEDYFKCICFSTKSYSIAVNNSFRWVTTTLFSLRTITCDALIVPSENVLLLHWRVSQCPCDIWCAGYVCPRRDVSSRGCCDESSGQFNCSSCKANACCMVYEHCVACCLTPDKVGWMFIVIP